MLDSIYHMTLTLKAQQTTNFGASFLIFEKNNKQTILMKYHTLFVSFEKAANVLKKQQNLKFSSAANCRWRFMG